MIEAGIEDFAVVSEAFIAGFLAWQEYFAKHNGDAADWLTAAYQNVLARRPDQAGLTGWLRVLGQ